MRHVDRKKRKTRRTAVASRLMSSAAMILLALAAAANGQGVKPGTPPPPPISIKAKPLQAFLGPETFAVQATGKRTPPNSATKLKATPDATIVAASGGCSPSPVTQGSTLTCTIDAGVSGQGAPPSGSVTLSVALQGTSASGSCTVNFPTTGYCVTAFPVSVAPGTYTLVFSPGDGYSSLTVTAKATPALSVSCSPNPVAYGANTNCTSSLTGGASPTGSVAWTINGGNWTTTGINGSAGGFAGYAPGIYTIGVSYSGDANNNAVSASTALTISKASSSVSVACSPNPIVYGEGNTTCTATVPSGATGSVAFTANNGVWGSVPLSGNTASATGWGGASWAPGTYPVGATYLGDGNYYPSTPESTTITISPASTVTQLSSSLNPSTYGQNVTFTSLVNTGGAVPTGTVTLSDSGVTLTGMVSTVSTVSTTNLALNSANLAGAGWAADTSGAGPTATANAALAPDGTTTTATLISFPAATGWCQWAQWLPVPSTLSSKTYTFSVWLQAASPTTAAIVLQDAGPNDWGAFGVNTVSVGTQWQRYTVTGTAPAGDSNNTLEYFITANLAAANIYAWGAQVEQTSSVGPYVATGSSPASGSGGLATFSTYALGGGTQPHSITAAYSGDSGDSNVTKSTSPALSQQVNQATPSISASCSPNPLIYSQFNDTTCTASVGGGATGTVTWTADGGEFDTTTTLSGGSTTAPPWGNPRPPGSTR